MYDSAELHSVPTKLSRPKPDHLGTSTFLTDANGNAYQFLLNLPFGETMAEQLGTNYYNTPYKFNGKELDEETGLYYYGARYYDGRTSVWASTDPLAEKYPNQSPYGFVGGNPISHIEVDGRYWVGTNGKAVAVHLNKNGSIVLGKNASADLRLLVKGINNSGSKTATNQIMKASLNKTKIHLKVETEVHNKEGQLGNGLLGLHQAHDESGRALKWDSKKNDFDGTPAYVKGEEGVYKEATITIFKGNIDEGGNGSYYGFDITSEQEMSNTFQHESNHDTDKEFIKNLRDRREGKETKVIDAHQNIHPQEQKVYEEMQKSNKKG